MRYEELSVPEIEALDRLSTVFVLPLGSVEQHGRHMPVGTDTLLAHAVAMKAAELAPRGRIVVLPPPWYGFSAHHMRFTGTVTLSAETMMHLVEDIVGSLVAHGFRHVLMVNGHGGNAGLVDVLSAVLGKRHYGRARIAGLTYFHLAREAVAAIRESGPGGMGHACEFETALVLHVRPDLVKMDRAGIHYPDPGSSWLATDLQGASPIRTYLDFRDVSPTGTFGDPSLATPEKGARFLAVVGEALAAFAEDFSRWPVQEEKDDR